MGGKHGTGIEKQMAWSLTTEVQINKLAEGLHEGHSRYVKCIFCNAEHENKLSLTRTEAGILYHCFRAKCGAKGIILFEGRYSSMEKDTFTPMPYTGVTKPVPPELWVEVFNTTEIELPANVLYEEKRNALMFPIYDADEYICGAQLKPLEYKQDKLPKYITYYDIKCPHSYYLRENTNNYQLIIVEDILSALKLKEYGSSVALLGTNLTNEGLRDIIKLNPINIVIMLDPGAEDKAMKIANKLSPFFTVRVVYLKADPKNTPYNELDTIFNTN